jgi:hypothetical protein
VVFAGLQRSLKKGSGCRLNLFSSLPVLPVVTVRGEESRTPIYYYGKADVLKISRGDL